MAFEVRSELPGLDPEARRAMVEVQTAVRREFDTVNQRATRPKRRVTALNEQDVIARPGEVVRVKPGATDITVYMPEPDPANAGEDIVVSVEGDGTAAGVVHVEPLNGTCDAPGITTLHNPGTYRYTSTGARNEGATGAGGSWGGPASPALEDLPELAPQRLLGSTAGGSPVETTASDVLDWVDSTRGTIPIRGAAAWQGLDPGTAELPIVSKGAGADPVYQRLANAGLATVPTATFKGRTTGGTGNVENMTATQATALLNTFTSTLKGLSPASGGGTVNFQRADGAWAAPPDTNTTYSAGNSTITLTGTAFSRPAITGEVTIPVASNASAIDRATDFAWTGDHYHSGEVGLVTEQTVTGAGPHEVTLGDGVTRLTFSDNGDVVLSNVSGGADTGRMVLVYYSGTGTLTVENATAGPSGNSSRLFAPMEADFTLRERGSFFLQANGSAGWRVVGLNPQPGALVALTVLRSLSGGTHVFNAATRFYHVWMVAGGGGGGGANSAAAQSACGAGGGGGAFFMFEDDDVSSKSWDVGGGGAAGASTGGDGGTGGDTSFGSRTVNGGEGGQGSANAGNGSGSGTTLRMTGPGGAGSLGGSGTFSWSCDGTRGSPGVCQSATAGWGGEGGLGGLFGRQQGGGGAGAFSANNADDTGENGQAGMIIVWEYS